jgi:biopolymer transport protein ExbD
MASTKKRAVQETEDGVPLDMSPMIDLTFLLLVFFMVASHLITVQIDRRVDPPTAKNAQVAKESSGRVVVNILADGSIWGQNEEELTTTEAIQDYVDQVRVRNEEHSHTAQSPRRQERRHSRYQKGRSGGW